MVSKITKNGKAASVPVGLTVATLAAFISTIVLSSILANQMQQEKVTWQQAGYWIMGILFTASFLSAKIAIVKVKRQTLILSMMSGLLYWGILFCLTALFFGGQYEGFLQTGMIIFGGSGTAAFLSVPQKNTGKIMKRGLLS